jgi:hypothetical protein
VISGTGFSSGSPCATLSYTPPSSLPVEIKKNVDCAKGDFTPTVAWTPDQVPGCTKNTSVTVLAVDHKTADPAAATVSILCEAALCPESFTKATVGTSMPTYFAGGHSVSGGPVGAGKSGLDSALTISTCSPQFVFTIKSRKQVSGGTEECLYEVGSVKPGPISGCAAVASSQKQWLEFLCPDTGACR